MCQIDGCDERVTPLTDTERTARKAHRCQECGRQISAGERYHFETYVEAGRVTAHKTCRHCMVARDWLSAECGGWIYEFVADDIREHVEEGVGGVGVKLLAAGMERKWTRRDGQLWRVPRMPPVGQ